MAEYNNTKKKKRKKKEKKRRKKWKVIFMLALRVPLIRKKMFCGLMRYCYFFVVAGIHKKNNREENTIKKKHENQLHIFNIISYSSRVDMPHAEQKLSGIFYI